MATKAVLACKTKAGNYIAKYVNYGADNYEAAKQLDYDEAMESVMQGDSANLADGFYMEYDFSVGCCGWPEKAYVEGLSKLGPKGFTSLKDLKAYASSVYAKFIFVVSEKDVTTYDLYEPFNDWVDEKELDAMYNGDEEEDDEEDNKSELSESDGD